MGSSYLGNLTEEGLLGLRHSSNGGGSGAGGKSLDSKCRHGSRAESRHSTTCQEQYAYINTWGILIQSKKSTLTNEMLLLVGHRSCISRAVLAKDLRGEKSLTAMPEQFRNIERTFIWVAVAVCKTNIMNRLTSKKILPETRDSYMPMCIDEWCGARAEESRSQKLGLGFGTLKRAATRDMTRIIRNIKITLA